MVKFLMEMETNCKPKALVHLALAVHIDPGRLFSLERQYLPLGKCGGYPAWLNPTRLPPGPELICKNCNAPMAFLLQVYCPGEPVHAFHRVIYVFVCPKGDCSKTNDATNFVVFRCQLPRLNAFYSPDSALDPSSPAGPIADPFFDPATFARLCIVCGCHATKRCSRCGHRWYCSRDHQIIDWSGVHKAQCVVQRTENGQQQQQQEDSSQQAIPPSADNDKAQRDKHGFTLKEFGMELRADDEEEEAGSEDGSDENEESGAEDEEEMMNGKRRTLILKEEDRQKIEEYRKLAESNGVSAKDVEGLEESRRDACFARFSASLSRCPNQILRYHRGGSPLLATDHSPSPVAVPNCELCGARREFEMQLMPNLIALMGLDSFGQSVDWATVLMFTCAANCQIPADGYHSEVAFKQDFVVAPESDQNQKCEK